MAQRRRSGADSGATGLLLVDKPEGPTSFDVIAKLRGALGTRAIGHAGTLDPLATGLLVVLAGPYTRLSQHLTGADKVYEATVAFGARTSTDDREGEVLEEGDPSGLTEGAVREALLAMSGPQRQVPPAYSAISVGGERLYAKARRGEEVEAPPRDVVLHELVLLSWQPPQARIFVRCSKGTYVRAIARDLGARLGVPAHLGALRRTASGAFRIEDAQPLAALLEGGVATAALREGPAVIGDLPLAPVTAEAAAALLQGKRVAGGAGLAGGVAVAHLGERLVGLVLVDDGTLAPQRALMAPGGLAGGGAGQ
jgi:tRNA pseudouridine55 synthase